MTSAYPLPVAELTDRVRAHAETLGAWPSLRTVMAEYRVGRPKATAALDALRTTGFDPTPDTADTADTANVDTASTDTAPVPVLQVVPDTTTTGGTDRVPAVADPGPVRESTSAAPTPADGESVPVSAVVDAPGPRWRFGVWPLVLIALGAFVSIWGGWVGLGELTGFGPIRLLPGIADQVIVNSAITLPIGVEAYAAFALRAWLAPSGGVDPVARRFARWSAIGALALGAAGQIAYHLMVAAGITRAPWPITAFVACLPVVVLGCGAALTHLIHHHHPAVDREAP